MATDRRIRSSRQCYEFRRVKPFLIVLFCLTLAACGRPLTPNEAQFAEDLFGDEIDVDAVRIAHFPGYVPSPRPMPDEPIFIVGTERACVRERVAAGERQPPSAFALWNMMQFDRELYAADMALQYPERARFPTTFILAHELTHVWQWQNRERTGYAPWRAVMEAVLRTDPYFSTADDAPVFLSFGYEQQAAMITDFVCFTTSNPDHPRRQELRDLILPVLPVDRFEKALGRGVQPS